MIGCYMSLFYMHLRSCAERRDPPVCVRKVSRDCLPGSGGLGFGQNRIHTARPALSPMSLFLRALLPLPSWKAPPPVCPSSHRNVSLRIDRTFRRWRELQPRRCVLRVCRSSGKERAPSYCSVSSWLFGIPQCASCRVQFPDRVAAVKSGSWRVLQHDQPITTLKPLLPVSMRSLLF